MSRIGKQPIIILDGVDVSIADQRVLVKGKMGVLEFTLHEKVKIEQKEKELIVSVNNPDNRQEAALWGTSRKIIANMVDGVTNGFTKQLEVNGVGYKVALSGNKVTLHVGYSHPVEFMLPEGITAVVDKNRITLSGIDKQLVGQVAANIRKIRKPEPYKGKGIKYVDEQIRRKAGKSAKAAA